MKFLDRFTKKFASKASTAVKKEVKKTALDLVPTILGIGASIAGILIFKGVVEEPEDNSPTFTTYTTNNYFFRDLSDDAIKKLMEDK